MTETQIRDALCELRSLERLQAAIARQRGTLTAPSDWDAAQRAIADRLRWFQYGLSLVDPDLMARVDARLNFEAQLPDPVVVTVPIGTRLH